MLSKRSDNGHPCFFLILSEKHLLFSSKYDVSLSFKMMLLIILKKFLSIPSLLRVFFFFLNHEWVLNFVRCFS